MESPRRSVATPRGAESVLHRLAGRKRQGVFLGALVVVLVALFLPGWFGTILLLAIVGALAWLGTRTWPVTPPHLRVMRVVILLLLVAVAIYKIR
ncbi:MAG TPA: DUF6703 family protein [Micromonosporaceae bacterium]